MSEAVEAKIMLVLAITGGCWWAWFAVQLWHRVFG